jgi:signal transduction histidine kinase
MIALRFHSPFFLLLVLATFFSCKDSNESTAAVNDEKNIKQHNSLGNAYFKSAGRYVASGQQDSLFKYYNLSRLHYELAHDSLQAAHKLLLLGDLYMANNDYIELENSSTQVFPLLDFSRKMDQQYAASAYNNLGLAYTNLGNFPEAISSYRKAATFIADALKMKTIENNIALVYMESGQYDKAMAVLDALSEDQMLKSDPEAYARALDNFGYSLFKTGNNGSAEMLRAFDLRKKVNDQAGCISSGLHLSEYFRDANPALARDYALEAYQAAKDVNSTTDRVIALDHLIKVNAGIARDRYLVERIRLGDSISKARQASRNQFAKYRYDTRIVNETNLKLKAKQAETALQLEKKKRQADSLYFGIGMLVALGLMIYILLRKRHREEKITISTKTEARIAKKVHDELANDVYNAMTFAETQDLSDGEKKETLLSHLDSVYTRTRDISRENSPVDIGIRYPEHLRIMLSSYNTAELNVIIQGIDTVPWGGLSENKKTVTWRVLQETMVNMKKHSEATLAAIRFDVKGKKLVIDYTDDGRGWPSGHEIVKNGLRNVENRIESIGGSVIFESKSGKGCQIRMAFPI